MDDIIDAEFEEVEIDTDELNDIYNDYIELCQTLDEIMNDLPPSVQEKIWDMVYKRFEP